MNSEQTTHTPAALREGHEMNSKLIVFALIQGSILGTRDTDDHGNPWTRRSANDYCQRENNLTAFRRSRNMPGPHFTFVVHPPSRAAIENATK